MEYVELRPHRIVNCFLLHPDSILSLNQGLSTKLNNEQNSSPKRVSCKPPPPTPKILLIKKSLCNNEKERWNGITASLEPGNRPFITAVNATLEATGIPASALQFVRSGPLISVVDEIPLWMQEQNEIIDSVAGFPLRMASKECTVPSNSKRGGVRCSRGASLSPTSNQSMVFRDAVVDLFKPDDETEQKTEWIVQSFLFQVLDLSSCTFYPGISEFIWVTPLEIELCENELRQMELFPGLSRFVASVYISPLLNKVTSTLHNTTSLGASALTKKLLEAFEIAIQDAWRVRTGDSDEPGAPPPEDCDESDFGAPYLSRLPSRLLLEHIQFFLLHLSLIRPNMAAITSMCRYVDHHIYLGLKFLDQCTLQEEFKNYAENSSATKTNEIIPSTATKVSSPESSLLRRITFRPFWLGNSPVHLNQRQHSDDAESNYSTGSQSVIELREKRILDAAKKKTPLHHRSDSTVYCSENDLYNKSIGRVLLAAARYATFIDSMVDSCIEHTKNILSEARRIMLYGNSSLVEGAIRKVCLDWVPGEPPLEIIYPEGRPSFDGVQAAMNLLKICPKGSLIITIISEAQIGIFIHQVNCVLVGADAILSDGSFINKVGTYLLALAAFNVRLSTTGHIISVPFFVISTTAKILPQLVLEQLSAAQMNDILILSPQQHPDGLNVIGIDDISIILKTPDLPPHILNSKKKVPLEEQQTDPKTSSPFIKEHPITDASFWPEGRLTLLSHLIDAKAPLGVVIETKASTELYSAFSHLFEQPEPNVYNKTNPILSHPITEYIQMKNVSYEITPTYLVSAYITERGILKPSDVSTIGGEFNDMVDQYIADQF